LLDSNIFTLGLSVVGDYVYYANGRGKIFKIRFDGQGESAVFSDGPIDTDASPGSGFSRDSVMIAIDDTYVYWTDWCDQYIRAGRLYKPHVVHKVAKVNEGSSARVGRIARKGDQLFWSAELPNAIWTARTTEIEQAATKVADKEARSDSADIHMGVAVDDIYVYWSDVVSSQGVIRRLPLDKIGDASAVEDFAVADGAGEIILDDTHVYFTTSAGIAVKRKEGSEDIVRSKAGRQGRGLLLDGKYVYWTTAWADSDSEKIGRIFRVRKEQIDADSEIIYEKKDEQPFQLAADCGAIYWSNFKLYQGSRGVIYKIRKPD
jgi:hypothetical protein